MTTTQSKTGVVLKIVGENGNAFFILGRAQQALKKAGKSDMWNAFKEEVTSGDYDHLLRTCMDWFDVDGDEVADAP